MKAYLAKYPDTHFTVLTLDNHVTQVYRQFNLPITVVTEPLDSNLDESFDEIFELGAGAAGQLADLVLRGEKKYLHIAQCFGRMMGVEVTDFRPTYRPVGQLPLYDAFHTQNAIFISPFSMSCTSRDKNRPGMPPNKMLPWTTWGLIIRQLRTFSLPIRCLGAKEDRAPMLTLSEEEYYTGVPLNNVALALQQCRMLVTVDNGMGHLAATLHRPMVVFYPMVLPVSFIGSVYNPRSVIIHVDPATTAPLNLYLSAKEGIDKCIERDAQISLEEKTR
jgi:hypothetical protein